MRTIILTEKQIKSAIDRVIVEQSIVRNEKRTAESLPPINIPYKFPSGYWMPTKELVTQVTTSLNPIIEFLKKHQSQKINVTIQAGESQVTNADNEPTSKNKGKTVPQKYLANGRANSIKSIINNYFDNLIKTNVITVKPEFTENQIVIGSTPYKKNVSNPQDPKYAQEQFINVIVNTTGELVTVEETCLVGLKIMIDYDESWCKQDNSRCHSCDESAYSIYANGIPVKDKNGSNLANLNNGGSGTSRRWVGVFSDVDAKTVLEGGKKEIVLSYQCESDRGNGCHSDSMHVTIYDNTNKQIFSDFVSGGYRLKKSDGQKMLVKTDECGNVLEVAPRLTAKPIPKRTVPRWDFNVSDPMNSLARVYLHLDSEGTIDWTKLYDPVLEPNVIKARKLQYPKWGDLLKSYNGFITKSQIKEIPALAEKLKSTTQQPTK
jgi:hypothetical protein